MKFRYSIIFALVLAATFFVSCSKSGSKSAVDRIIFVTIDTLRADRLGMYGYPREVSPFLDYLANDGVIFNKAFSASSHTAPSHSSMFTSLYPFEHGVLANHDILAESILSLPSLAKKSGFSVGGFPAVKFLEGKVGFPKTGKGMDKAGGGLGKFFYRNAGAVVDDALMWIEERKEGEKFLLWIHVYDVHQWAGKGNLPEEYWDTMQVAPDKGLRDYWVKTQNIPPEFFKTEEGFLKAMNGYDARTRYVDDELKRLHSALEKHGFNKRSLWIVTSDHGEGLGNHNYEGHGEFLYNEQLHVPLFFRFSDAPYKSRIESLARSVDLFPTIAELIGTPITEHPIRGRSLMPLLKDGKFADDGIKFNFAERRPKDKRSLRRDWEEGDLYAIQSLDEKFINHTQGVDEYFDLKSDPFELKNKAGDNPAGLGSLKNELTEIRKNAGVTPEATPEPSLDNDAVEELKTLGYL